jgi:23S rRNA (adenine2503-C2)-methyltransferase
MTTITRISEFRQRLAAAGAGPRHATLLLRAFARGLPLKDCATRRDASFPARLLRALPELQQAVDGLLTLASRHPAADGSARLLVNLADGQPVETVLLPPHGVCVSSQVGCAVGCVFCMTGREGLQRQVGSAEMVAQVSLARQHGPLRRVVFMGMGEPSHNLDNVIEAIQLLGSEGNIGHKELVFSTVGDRRVFERLPTLTVKPALALSLHTSKTDLRRQLLPRAPDITPAELVELGEAYARATGYPIQYQWTLLSGINDGDDELAAIAALLKGRYAMMNFIPYNRVEGLPYARPDWERAEAMARYLVERGVLAKLRRSAGQDVEGGCGQLRARRVNPVAGDAAASAAQAK